MSSQSGKCWGGDGDQEVCAAQGLGGQVEASEPPQWSQKDNPLPLGGTEQDQGWWAPCGPRLRPQPPSTATRKIIPVKGPRSPAATPSATADMGQKSRAATPTTRLPTLPTGKKIRESKPRLWKSQNIRPKSSRILQRMPRCCSWVGTGFCCWKTAASQHLCTS